MVPKKGGGFLIRLFNDIKGNYPTVVLSDSTSANIRNGPASRNGTLGIGTSPPRDTYANRLCRDSALHDPAEAPGGPGRVP